MQIFCQLQGKDKVYPVHGCTFISQDQEATIRGRDHHVLEFTSEKGLAIDEWLKQPVTLLLKSQHNVGYFTGIITQLTEIKQGYRAYLHSLLDIFTWEKRSCYHAPGTLQDIIEAVCANYSHVFQTIEVKFKNEIFFDKTQLQYQETDDGFLQSLFTEHNIRCYIQQNGCDYVLIFSDSDIYSKDPEEYIFVEKKGFLYPENGIFQLKKVKKLLGINGKSETYWIAKSHSGEITEDDILTVEGHPNAAFNRTYYVRQVQHSLQKKCYENTFVLDPHPRKNRLAKILNPTITTGIISSEKNQMGNYQVQLDAVNDENLSMVAIPIFPSACKQSGMQLPYQKHQSVLIFPDREQLIILGAVNKNNDSGVSQVKSGGSLTFSANSMVCASSYQQNITMLQKENMIQLNNPQQSTEFLSQRLLWQSGDSFQWSLGGFRVVNVDENYTINADNYEITTAQHAELASSGEMQLISHGTSTFITAQQALTIDVQNGINIVLKKGDSVLRGEIVEIESENELRFVAASEWKITSVNSEIYLDSKGNINMISKKISIHSDKIMFNGMLQYVN